MRYFRMTADEHGESSFEEVETSFEFQIYAPPAPEFGVSAPSDASRYVFANFPTQWTSDLHPSPRRQLFILLSGSFEGLTSDGRSMVFAPGDMVLMEDVSGKGHSARVLGDEAATAIMIHLD